MAVKVKKKEPEGIAKTFDDIGSWLGQNIAAPFANSVSNIGDYLAGRPPENIGSKVFGQPPTSTRARAGGGTFTLPAPKAAIPDEQTYQPGFLDFLQQAQQLMGSGGGPARSGVDFAGLRAQSTQTADDASARLRAMYAALHDRFVGDAPAIQQNFDQGAQSVGDNAAEATGNVNDAYDAARQAQTAQLAALGIGDAAGVIAGNGESSTNDQAHAVANIAQNQAANQNQLSSGRTASLNYNGQIADAALQQGTDSASQIQRALQDKLAEISAQEAQANAQAAAAGNGQDGVLDLAKALFDANLQQNGNYQQQASAQYNAQKLAQSGAPKASDAAKQQGTALTQAIALMKAQPGLSFADALAAINNAYK